MRSRAGVLLGMVAGAIAGAAAGYLYLTDDGRRVRRQLEPRLDELAGHASRLRELASHANAAARDGWRIVADAAAERAQTS